MQIWGSVFTDINGLGVQGFQGSLFIGKFKALKLELGHRKVNWSHLGLHAQVFLKEKLHGWVQMVSQFVLMEVVSYSWQYIYLR